MRATVTDVARLALAQPTAGADDVTGPDDDAVAAAAPAAVEPATEPQPASPEHSSTASTVPRTWRGDIMLLGRTSYVISSIPGRLTTG
jgi:hypothetical protein